MTQNSSTFAIIPAAGIGSRLGFSVPKAFVELQGRTLLERSIDALVESTVIDHIIVVVSEGMLEQAQQLCATNEEGWKPVTLQAVVGGAERADSVYQGLCAVQDHPDFSSGSTVAVHDAARALVPSALVKELVLTSQWANQGVIPVLPVADTIKQVEQQLTRGDVLQDVVSVTPPRAQLRIVQTPQVFPASPLISANKKIFESNLDGETDSHAWLTDDASIMEHAGQPPIAITGADEALKITMPTDMVLAEHYLNRMNTSENIREETYDQQ